jgi:hypothetical protein
MLAHRPPARDARRCAANAQRARLFLGSWREEVVHPCGRNPRLVEPGTVVFLAARRGLSADEATVFEKACAHLAWLARERARLRRERAAEAARAAAKRAQLDAESQLLRDCIRCVGREEEGAGVPAERGEGEGGAAPAAGAAGARPAAPPPPPLPQQQPLRPGWARSAAEEAVAMDAEVEGLVDFARALDADAFLADLDVRCGICAAPPRHPPPRPRASALSNNALHSHHCLLPPYPTQLKS